MVDIFRLFGMFSVPRPIDKINSTIRDTSNCTEVFPGFNSTFEESTNIDAPVSSDFPGYYGIFWISSLFTPFFCIVCFTIAAIPVSLFTKNSSYKFNPDLHISLFQGRIWPNFIRDSFKLTSNEALCKESTNEKLLEEIK